jgi:glutathionylspermidine amidase/synthetase
MAVRGVRAPLSVPHLRFCFTDVGMAYEIFSLRFLREVVNDNILPLQAFANGARRPPIAGSLLIWQKGGEFKHTGHVAVITQLVGNKVASPSRT